MARPPWCWKSENRLDRSHQCACCNIAITVAAAVPVAVATSETCMHQKAGQTTRACSRNRCSLSPYPPYACALNLSVSVYARECGGAGSWELPGVKGGRLKLVLDLACWSCKSVSPTCVRCACLPGRKWRIVSTRGLPGRKRVRCEWLIDGAGVGGACGIMDRLLLLEIRPWFIFSVVQHRFIVVSILQASCMVAKTSKGN